MIKKTEGLPPSKIKKVESALNNTQEALREVNTVFSLMSDKQRLLFSSLAQGKDELVSMLEAGMESKVFGICKIVRDKDGKSVRTSSLTVDNLKKLDILSYQRLLKIAQSTVKSYLGSVDYQKYLPDIQNLFKLVAPEAFQKMAYLMQNAKNEKIQAEMAKEILDRGGYQANSRGGEKEMPVQVNIIIPPNTNYEEVKVYGTDTDSN